MSSTNGATDAGKSLLGGRKPTDLKPSELDKASGTELAGVVGEAVQQGKKGKGDDQSSLRIHIELDLDVEVHLTARVKVSVHRDQGLAGSSLTSPLDRAILPLVYFDCMYCI